MSRQEKTSAPKMLSMRGAVVEPAVLLVEAGGVTRSGPQAEVAEVWKGENVAALTDFCNYCRKR